MTPHNITEFFERLRALNPDPKTELDYTNPYTLLVAIILSAQSTDTGVNKATKALFKKIQTPKQMLKLGEAGLKEHIKSIGLFNTKAKNILALSQKLVNDFDSEIPRDMNSLLSLPGVGRKTANVLKNVAWGEPTMAVDTHVFRVANRTGLAIGKTPDEIEEKLIKAIPLNLMNHAHHWLVLHGRYICKARSPDCANCPVADLCQKNL
ncbi:MAG: endonuclease III [Alphaproteobacteria bacterium]|nr:endonuclease III [Alphaproteobacteria bacterium]